MATWTDRTAFRTITEDGELIDSTDGNVEGNTLGDFTAYTATQDVPGTIAQWYVVVDEDDHWEGDVLAEASEASGLTTYPAADIFV